MIELVDQPRLISQIASLERRTARGGRDSIDHPPNGHDDLANVVAGVASMFTNTSRYITDLSWVDGDGPVDLHRRGAIGVQPVRDDEEACDEDQGDATARSARSMTATSCRTARRSMVALPFMDARRGMIHDGNGGPVGQRPGFLFSDNEADDQARRGCLSGIRRNG